MHNQSQFYEFARGGGQAGRCSGGLPIAGTGKDCYVAVAMEELFGDPSYKGFVLQDKKRLPARFFARLSGALLSRLR